MRMSLESTRSRSALVLFGLVPASIVAWFAYKANDDFKKKQIRDHRQAADGHRISDHAGHLTASAKTAPKIPTATRTCRAEERDRGSTADRAASLSIRDHVRRRSSWSNPKDLVVLSKTSRQARF